MALWKCSPIYMTFIFPLMIIVWFSPGFWAYLIIFWYIWILLEIITDYLSGGIKGGMGAFAQPPPVRGSAPTPPSVQKISHFRQFFYFCPPETHFAPQCPHKNFWCRHCFSKWLRYAPVLFLQVLRVLFMEEGLSICSLIHRHNLGLRITVLGKP